MKRPAFFLLAASLLASCSFGTNITADEPLSKVYQQAAHDADTTELERVTDVRKRQEAELEHEIFRLCGTLQDGTTPPNCKLPEIDTKTQDTRDSAEVLADAAASIEAEINQVPRESVIVLARQYAELATLALHSPELPKDIQLTTPHDVERLRAAIDHEYGNAYALEVAAARDNAGNEARFEEQTTAHRKTAEDLSKYLQDSVPAPAAGYTINDPITDANGFAAILEKESVNFWLAEAAAAETDDWRIICLRAGSAAALRALLFDPNTDYLHTAEQPS